MAGHNKWSKIKHKKAAADAQKGRLFSKHAHLIALESKKAGGDVAAPGLSAAVERAKKDLMPKENIERAIQKGSGVFGNAPEEVLYETYGPGGTPVLIAAVTDNTNRTGPQIKHLLLKAGYQLGAPGSAVWAFEKTAGGYVANTPLHLSNEDAEKLAELTELLENHDDVQDVYTAADEL